MRKNVSLLAMGCAALAVGGWWYFSRTAPAPSAPVTAGPVMVETAQVVVGPIAREITAFGSLRSDEAVVIRPEIAGRVKAIGFDEGARVSKGQVLLRLDDSSLAADLVQAQANLALSKANSESAVTMPSYSPACDRWSGWPPCTRKPI